MRLYNIAFGILLILPIIDFALAAPVLVQEDSRAGVGVVHMRKDVITTLKKRMPVDEGEIAKLGEVFDTSGKSAESSDAHASSSSAQPGPADHGSTSDATPPPPPPPPPKPESSTANLEHGPVESTNPSSTAETAPPDTFDQRIDKAWVAHNAAFLKKGPDASHAPASDPASSSTPPVTGSFDDHVTSVWDTHYDGYDPSHALAAVPVPGSFDDQLNAAWASRYNEFLKKGSKDTIF